MRGRRLPRVRFLLVAGIALTLVSVAWGAGPSSVNVTLGTVLHGDATSLNAVDGDTLDIEAEWSPSRQRFVIGFFTDYPPVTWPASVHYGAWATRGVKCSWNTPHSAVRIRKTLTTGSFVYGGNPVGTLCKAPTMFVVHFDEQSVSSD